MTNGTKPPKPPKPSKPCKGCGKIDECLCLVIRCFMKEARRMGSCCQDYIQASGSESQRIVEADVGQEIKIDSTDGARGIVNADGQFTVRRDGTYGVIAAPQVGRTDQAAGGANFRCWLMVNGSPVPNSNVLMTVLPVGQDGQKDVIVSQGFVELEAGDVVSVMMATDNPQAGVSIEAIQPSPAEPLVPSIIFSMWELCCDE